MPYGGGYSDLSSKNNKLIRYNFIKKSKKGAILIEFAFAVPVLFSLIYYISDLAKMKRYQERVDFVAHQIVQMLQTISNNQPITKSNIRHVVSAAYLSLYPGKTLYTTSGPKGPFYGPGIAHGQIYYITCDNNGKASVKWKIQFQFGGDLSNESAGPTPDTIVVDTSGEDERSSVRVKSNVSPSEIYPSLSMNPGENKIIVEALIFFQPHSTYWKKVNGSWKSPREEFGFYLISPKPIRTKEFYFMKTAIFTPKPGLFSETAPR